MRPGHRIDHYLLRERSSQASETQRQDLTHSPPSISTQVAESISSTTSKNLEPSHLQPALKNIQGHRPQVKWPKSSSKKEWATIDADLTKILDRIRGTVEKKLEKMGDMIYSYGAERFKTKNTGKKDRTPTTPPKSRRQQEIQRLVKKRRNLRKQWKRASAE